MTEHEKNWEESNDFTHSKNCSGIHRGAYCYTLDDIRGVICMLTSKLLDNPNEYGIYPTTEFYNETEKYIKKLLFQEIQSTRTATIQECIHSVKTNLVGFEDTNFEPQYKEYNDGYNQALSHVEQSLKELLEKYHLSE